MKRNAACVSLFARLACLQMIGCLIHAPSAQAGMIYHSHASVAVEGGITSPFGILDKDIPPFSVSKVATGLLSAAASGSGSNLIGAFNYLDPTEMTGTATLDFSASVLTEYILSTGKLAMGMHLDMDAQMMAGLYSELASFAQLDVRMKWADAVFLEYTGDGDTPALPSYLRVEIKNHGTASYSAAAGADEAFKFVYNGQGAINSVTTIVGDAVVYSTAARIFNQDVSFGGSTGFNSYYSPGAGFYDTSWYVQAGLNLRVGSVRLSAGNTFEYAAILMPDGSTPESHGWHLRFDSGIDSPNLASATAVPEPNSLALLGLASIGMTVGAWRRRQRAA